MAHLASREMLDKVMIGMEAAAIAVLGLFLILFFGQPEVNTLEYEVAKMCLQMAGIILFGAFVALATFLFQHEWEQDHEGRVRALDRKREADIRESDRLREDLIRKSDTIREDRRRESANLQDERKRQDDALRSMLRQTLEAYNDVKRIRRILRAQTGDGKISKETYEQLLLEFNDYQLVFEQLGRTVRTLDDKRLRWVPGVGEEGPGYEVKVDYDGIESYLRTKIMEFEKKLQTVKNQGSVPLATLNELYLFVTDTKDFRGGIARPFKRIERIMQKALLVPLELPMAKPNG